MSKSSSLPKKDLELRTGWKLHEKLSKNYTTYLTKNKLLACWQTKSLFYVIVFRFVKDTQLRCKRYPIRL